MFLKTQHSLKKRFERKRNTKRENRFKSSKEVFQTYKTSIIDKGNKIQIEPKYSTLKEELLCNNIYQIELSEWDIQYENGEKKKKTFGYMNLRYKTMSIEAILSICIYCNMDDLQYYFRKVHRETIKSMNEYGNWIGFCIVYH